MNSKANELKLNSRDFFYCYDHNLSRYLTNNGIRYITKAISSKSYRTYYMFLITEELNAAIQQYRSKSGAPTREIP